MVNSSNLLAALSVLILTLTGQTNGFSVEPNTNSRRAFLSKVATTTAASTAIVMNNPFNALPAVAAAPISTASLVNDLETSLQKMVVIPELLDQGEWDKVRTILKTPPVNKLWNLGESQNTLVILAKETGEFELLELKDELAISLQMCDQLTYDNAFVYFQPGNGKVKIKEPKDLANKAMSQIQDAIKMSSN
mmetsp:Transcript_6383/g.9687  ORF Transcript_6383/g.9687 Transcript_6383/m.9687 type:complete len:192 (-) Transcript_6383:1385-1960(-)|eukprot:CAMPEP_0203667230 /NCGR_PEP_ID=MMETSP0090-20130426/4108_1 /ASSEMBLY_ACC=CAM_ASM_001088 /TAXON_ID=426623 /ORGANISM="Chaetoceros affinis, Strain CCMP159" /LENGTH=191 /DNA_ID=CAMNT_0050531339 /DNA_START=101 /DNA_END=676 /DNA_ORIENTATION=+